MKVKVFDSRKSIDLEKQINEFIADKVVYDIRQSTFTVPAKIDKDGKTVRVDIFSRVIVMYDDVKKDVSRGLRRGFGVFDDLQEVSRQYDKSIC